MYRVHWTIKIYYVTCYVRGITTVEVKKLNINIMLNVKTTKVKCSRKLITKYHKFRLFNLYNKQ